MSIYNHDSSFAQLPSIVSGSFIASETQPFNELSIKFIMEEKLSILMDHSQTPKMSLKRQLSQELLLLQLKRHTSFQQILVQNHKNILLKSLKQYFQAIEHTLIDKLSLSNEQAQLTPQHLKEKEIKLQGILKLGNIQKKREKQIITRLKHNLDETNLIYDILSRCPYDISFQIVVLISSIFSSCDTLIDNFNRKNITKELQNKGKQITKTLIDDKLLNKLFQTSKPQRLYQAFEMLIQKCLISLFLMKVGVFDNELQTKSIEECLTSQIFKEITINDLLNQHLLKPMKKRKME